MRTFKNCNEIYLEKSMEQFTRIQAHHSYIFTIKPKEEIELKIDAIIDFLSQPEFTPSLPKQGV